MTVGDWVIIAMALFNVGFALLQQLRGHKLTLKAVEKALYANRTLLASTLREVAAELGKGQVMITEPSPASVSDQVKS